MQFYYKRDTDEGLIYGILDVVDLCSMATQLEEFLQENPKGKRGVTIFRVDREGIFDPDSIDWDDEEENKMRYIEAPVEYDPATLGNSIFLAGGITGCPDWQQEMVRRLKQTNLTLLNPRRADFPIGDPNAALAQITWEHNALRDAKSILFWFPQETICPIVLYELGAWSMTSKPIFVGVHPEYQRRQDVEIQTGLARPEIMIVYSLDELAEHVIRYGNAIP